METTVTRFSGRTRDYRRRAGVDFTDLDPRLQEAVLAQRAGQSPTAR
jgi:hypothetical protein